MSGRSCRVEPFHVVRRPLWKRDKNKQHPADRGPVLALIPFFIFNAKMYSKSSPTGYDCFSVSLFCFLGKSTFKYLSCSPHLPVFCSESSSVCVLVVGVCLCS